MHFGGWAGHASGVNFSAQGNTLASEAVVTAMAAAYEQGKGTMAERLMDALEAGQAKGGDTRGMQAAGILVVAPITNSETTTDRVIDIRVDDYPDPFKELRRVLNVRLSGTYVQRSADLAKEGKTAEALEMQKLAAKMHPRSERIQFDLAERYARGGRVPERSARAAAGGRHAADVEARRRRKPRVSEDERARRIHARNRGMTNPGGSMQRLRMTSLAVVCLLASATLRRGAGGDDRRHHGTGRSTTPAWRYRERRSPSRALR